MPEPRCCAAEGAGLAAAETRRVRHGRGNQRERDEARNDHCGREHETELAEQAPCGARQKGDGDEHGNQHCGGGDDREEHLPRAEHRSRKSAESHAAATLHVLENDDRVVDDQARGEHEGEQGEDVH